MSRKSKIETSEHYNEIVELLVAGYSPRYVSTELENKYNEKISHTALNNYKKNKLNIKAAVRKKIIDKEKEKKKKEKSLKKVKEASKEAIEKEAEKEIQAQETFEVVADYRFRDIQKLDDLISLAESINLDLDATPWDEDKYDPYKEQRNKIKLKELGLKAVKLKYELIDEDELNVNLHNDDVIGLADSIERSRQKYFQEIEKE